MSQLKFIATVVSKSATRVTLTLQDTAVQMDKNGDTWTGVSDPLDVSGPLSGNLIVKGFKGTKWTVDLSIQCDGGKPQNIFSKDDGSIPNSGRSQLTISADVPEKPCPDAKTKKPGADAKKQGASDAK